MEAFADERRKKNTQKGKKFSCFNTTRRLINSWTMNKVRIHTHTLQTRFFVLCRWQNGRYSVYLSLIPYPSNFCDTEVLLYCKFISKIMVSGHMSRATESDSKRKKDGIAKKTMCFFVLLLVYGVAKIRIEKKNRRKLWRRCEMLKITRRLVRNEFRRLNNEKFTFALNKHKIYKFIMFHFPYFYLEREKKEIPNEIGLQRILFVCLFVFIFNFIVAIPVCVA